MKSIAVIGQGTAGILSLCHFLHYTDDTIVTLIHDPNKNTLGIGESTNSSFVDLMQQSIDFDLVYDLPKINGTLKVGTVFKDWRGKPILNPLIDGTVAVHFDTNLLAPFVIYKLKLIYKNRFNVIEDTVNIEDIKNNYDYVINCTGFPNDYTDYTIANLPTNSCLIHNINEPGTWNYTGHQATHNGWIFEIPLLNRQSYGYLYNDTINTKEEILKDFGIEKESAEYKYKPYYKNNLITDNVIANGNAAVFFEPMAATSLWLYDKINRIYYDYIYNNVSLEHANEVFIQLAQDVESIIKVFYQGGSVKGGKFWDYATNISLNLQDNLKFVKFLDGTLEDDWVFNNNLLQLIRRRFFSRW